MNPILHDFPDAFETERLLIRAPRPGDGAEVNAAIQESLESLRRWMPWAQEGITPEETEANIRQACAAWVQRTDLRLHLYLRETGAFVGSSGLHRIKWEVPLFEIGYWCRQRYQGQGYITEAVRGITRFGFEVLGANRMEIRCASPNGRSRAVAERAGYTMEAELRNQGRTDGELRSTLIFSLIPEEFRARYGQADDPSRIRLRTIPETGVRG